MKFQIKPIVASVMFAAISFPAIAGVEADMADMYNQMGAVTSYTESGAYKSQSANMYTGGGFSAKWGNKTINPFSIQLPSVKAGCGGIDFFSGAFSFANKEQFVEFTRNLGNNAAGVAFEIALDALDPLIGNSISKIRDLVNRVNQMGMNSCEAAQQAGAGIAGLIADNMNNDCQAQAIANGTADDGANAKWYCRNGNNVVKERLKARADGIKSGSASKNSVDFTGGNSTLFALSKFNIPNEDKMWLMSILGTMIVVEPNSNDPTKEVEPNFLFPTITNVDDIVKFTGVNNVTGKVDVTLYECFEPGGGSASYEPLKATQCNQVTKQYTSLKSLVTARVKALKDSIASPTGKKTDTGIGSDPGILQLVENSSFPILQMALIDVRTEQNFLTDKAVDALTLDLAESYFNRLIKIGQEVLGKYPSRSKTEETARQNAMNNISEAKSQITAQKQVAFQKMASEASFAQYVQVVKAQLKSTNPDLLNSLNASKAMTFK